MSYNEFDDFDDAGGKDEFDDWSDKLDSALLMHRVNPTAFTHSERIAAFAEGDDFVNLAESFARSHYAALAGYDEPVDHDDHVNCSDCPF